MQDEVHRLQERLRAADTCVDALQQELAVIRQVSESQKDSLRAREGSEQLIAQQLAQVQQELTNCKAQLVDATNGGQKLQQQLEAMQQSNNNLEAQLSSKISELSSLQDQLSSLSAALDSERKAWGSEKHQFLVSVMSVCSSIVSYMIAALLGQHTYYNCFFITDTWTIYSCTHAGCTDTSIGT